MQGTLGHSAWRWLFWIEGAVTMGVAISGKWHLCLPLALHIDPDSRIHPPRLAYQLQRLHRG